MRHAVIGIYMVYYRHLDTLSKIGGRLVGDGSVGSAMTTSVYFPEFSFIAQVNQPVLHAGVSTDRLTIRTTRLDARWRLNKLAQIITGVDLIPTLTKDVCEIWLDQDYCVWFHQARGVGEAQHPQNIVHIQHPTDVTSVLLLRNTDQGLVVTPTGVWEGKSEALMLAAGHVFVAHLGAEGEGR